MGYPTKPEIQYGFGLSGGYKNFDVSFFFQGNAHVSFYIDPGKLNNNEPTGIQGIAPFVSRRNAPAIVARGSWSEVNPDIHAFWPRLSPDIVSNNIRQSSWWLREGSFIRLKSVELGYNFTNVKKFFMQSVRVYVTLENLLYFSSFKLWDPEMGGNGLGYPINRRYNIGIMLNF
jgi:hypothetical protein